MPTIKFKCPSCGKYHSVFIDDENLPCEDVEATENELFVPVEAEAVELKDSAFNKHNG